MYARVAQRYGKGLAANESQAKPITLKKPKLHSRQRAASPI